MWITKKDADTEYSNSGLIESVNLEMRGEVVEYMYRNGVEMEEALDAVNGWINA